MHVVILADLVTRRAPDNVPTPWLTGRATHWQVCQDYVVQIDGVEYTVPENYIFDGASIPWWLWAVFPPSYSPAWRAAALHDYLYSHLYRQVTKRWADEAFRSIMLADGASEWIANRFHWAVSTFGKGGWHD